MNNIETWSDIWQLKFNSEKCETMRITHAKDFSKSEYYMSNRKLQVVGEVKDLGITITHHLTWETQVFNVVNKANRILGFVRRTVGSSNQSTFTLLYTALVRPVLEYAAPVWSPYLVKDIKALESVQRRASRIALNQKQGEMSYEDRWKLLQLNTLEERREYFSVIECYKIVFDLNGINFNEVFECKKSKITRANHKYSLYTKLSRINCYKHSFFVRIVSAWNSLPKYVVEAGSLAVFKKELKKHINIY